jgi:hypothetical protein
MKPADRFFYSYVNVCLTLLSTYPGLSSAQQHRLVPGGKETTPGQIFVTTKRVIIETSSWLGLKKEYQDLHYSDILGVDLLK